MNCFLTEVKKGGIISTLLLNTDQKCFSRLDNVWITPGTQIKNVLFIVTDHSCDFLFYSHHTKEIGLSPQSISFSVDPLSIAPIKRNTTLPSINRDKL